MRHKIDVTVHLFRAMFPRTTIIRKPICRHEGYGLCMSVYTESLAVKQQDKYSSLLVYVVLFVWQFETPLATVNHLSLRPPTGEILEQRKIRELYFCLPSLSTTFRKIVLADGALLWPSKLLRWLPHGQQTHTYCLIFLVSHFLVQKLYGFQSTILRKFLFIFLLHMGDRQRWCEEVESDTKK